MAKGLIAPATNAKAYHLELPASLESQRPEYQSDIDGALNTVVELFSAAGFHLAAQDLIDRAVVFDDGQQAREAMARVFGTDVTKVPETFSGTVNGKTLYLVSREVYAHAWHRLYSDWPWTPETYRGLAVHELTHRAHESIAIARLGGADAMGPPWFFEGLAVACAGQFAVPDEVPLPWQELIREVGHDVKPKMSYPRLGKIVRSLAASFPIRFLVEHAGRPDFPESLEREYLPSDFVLENPVRRPSRGTILLIHGSAPFDKDGRIPGAAPGARYGTEPFYRDLARSFRSKGWSVLRYSKPGVLRGRIDGATYCTTDLDVLSHQLRNLWRFMPADRPRIVFAWSEGSLHVRALPLDEVSAVILLGGIATGIGDVIIGQGGPRPRSLKRSISGRVRTEMLDSDRPVGRLLDELALEDNWKVFKGHPKLPLLILQGRLDREVTPGQAEIFAQRLSGHALTLAMDDRLDHRYMIPGRYEPSRPAAKILEWLDGIFPAGRDVAQPAGRAR